MRKPKDIAITRDGVSLAGLDFPGSGMPVMLFHGLAGYAGEWRMTADGLSDRRVVALDGRGHGRSERFPEDVSIAAHAEDAAHVISELGLGQVVAIGQSLGALTAITLAANHPELVKAMVVVDADPAAGSQATVADVEASLRRWPVPFDSVLAAARYFGGSPGSAAAWANGLEHREDGWWPRFDFEVMTKTLQEALGRDYWDEWGRVRCPVLVLRAEHGDVSEATAQEMTERLPTARTIEIPGAGHDLHLDSPKEWQAVLGGFLEAIDGAAAEAEESA
jgi:pimeloyl-ACP methyl ester carboxylesterase